MKYFVCSDIHSFYTEFKTALDHSGFDIENKEHCLVICGDIFDRGRETRRVYNFLQKIPQDRLKLIRGNHESLYLELLSKDFPEEHDFHNGTVRTFCAIAHMQDWESDITAGLAFCGSDFEVDQAIALWEIVLRKVRRSRITRFIKSAQWLDYFELKDYVLVHSFVPVKVKDEYITMFKYWPTYNMSINALEYYKDWRNADHLSWEDAKWGCPWAQYKAGLWKEDKTLVCGHWHTSDFFTRLSGDSLPADYRSNPIFKTDRLIAIDACTVTSKKVNVLVIEED